MTISKTRKLTLEEEINLNRIDKLITTIMLRAEQKIHNQHHNSPWSPELHDSIQIVSIWKSILSQFKTKLSFQKQINFFLSSLSSPIDIEWTDFTNIKYKLSRAQTQLRKNKNKCKRVENTTSNAKSVCNEHC